MKRFTPSMVISLLALFVALSGTSVAASRAFIGSKDIADHSIRLVDLHSSAVKALKGQRGAPGRNGAPGAQGPAGPQGPQGPTGATGATGATGPVGTSGASGANGTFDPNKIQYISGADVVLHPGDTGSAEANCPAGTTAISGGFFASIAEIAFSETFGRTFHGIAAHNGTSIDVSIRATVVCAA